MKNDWKDLIKKILSEMAIVIFTMVFVMLWIILKF